jgi:hypothetical protein
MALPNKVKTWQISANNTVAAQGSLLATNQLFMHTLKTRLLTFALFPWTVVGSSNSVTFGLDAVDRWVSTSNLVWANPGSNHSWIVLKQTGIASNFQICISLNSSNVYQVTIAASLSAGFTGGSLTARPTAADEYVLLNQSQFVRSSNIQQQLNVWQSNDGTCTRVVGISGGNVLSTFLQVEVPINVVSGWTTPNFCNAVGTDSAGQGLGLISNFFTTSQVARGRSPVGNFSLAYAGEANSSGVLLAQMTDVGSVTNSFEGGFPFFPVFIYSASVNNKGRHGTLADLYWRNLTTTDGDTWPNSVTQRDWVTLGSFHFPWLGNSTTPLLT